MENLTKEEIKAKRKHFLTKSDKVTTIHKDDKRVNGSRICSVCGSQLSSVILSTGGTKAIRHHYHCHFSELFYVDICKDIRSCYRTIDKMRGDNS